jgi:hypothetical protein
VRLGEWTHGKGLWLGIVQRTTTSCRTAKTTTHGSASCTALARRTAKAPTHGSDAPHDKDSGCTIGFARTGEFAHTAKPLAHGSAVDARQRRCRATFVTRTVMMLLPLETLLETLLCDVARQSLFHAYRALCCANCRTTTSFFHVVNPGLGWEKEQTGGKLTLAPGFNVHIGDTFKSLLQTSKEAKLLHKVFCQSFCHQ